MQVGLIDWAEKIANHNNLDEKAKRSVSASFLQGLIIYPVATQTETAGPLGSVFRSKAPYSVDKTVMSQKHQELRGAQKKEKRKRKRKKNSLPTKSLKFNTLKESIF